MWRIFEKHLDGRTSAQFAHSKQRYRPLGSGPRLPHQSMAPARRRTFFSKRSVYRSPCREQSQDVERSQLGKSLSRANRKSDWQTADVSTPAIVRSKLISTAKKIQRGTQLCPPGHQRRFRRVLSALLRCGSCGSGMAMDGRDESGHICCSAAVTAACPPDAPGSGAHQRQ